MLLTIIGILFVWHLFLYLSTVHFFGISGRTGRLAVGLLFLILPSNLFLTMGVVRRMEGKLASGYYTVSMLWLGVGLALLLSFVLAWAAWGVSRFHNPRPGATVFGKAALLATCLYSTYGIWNACHPRIREIAVEMAGLPQAWQGRRLVQISDLHLGLTFGVEFLEGVVKQVNSQNPAAVFITGDLFDGGDRNVERFAIPLGRIRAPLGVYAVTGNHDTYLGVERARAVLRRAGVRVLDGEMVSVEGLQILGAGYSRRDIGRTIRELPQFNPKEPSILLYHSPSRISEVKAAGISLQLSGHTHYGQIFPFHLVTRRIYGKYYRGLHVEDGFALYTSPGTGLWGPLMRIGNTPEITVIRLQPR